ncbi:hypothetical protein GYMLUDRAFT_644241 [Collybiopsis luxurians FD-317 M1]|nr:hypothetical protein GYMLUDRAFT_644241 [Collybiopsis luxurians FD-317 M1]
MLLLQLPDDVLFHILGFLEPPDLIQLRKACKRLQTFTFRLAVWKAAYIHSGYFLPPGPLPSQTAHDLERLLLRTHRWNNIWKQQVQPVVHTLGYIWSFQTEIDLENRRRHIELVHSRYLSIKGPQGMQVYDLETKTEIFKYQATSDERLVWPVYGRCGTVESDAKLGLFTPFIRNTSL